MAIKKIIEIDVEQVKAMGGLDALQKSLAETETKSASLKTELRKLKEQLAELPEGSAEYNKIAKQAGEVSDKIGDINTRIKNLGSDTKNIDAVVQGTQALSGAFSVATSASALLGNENKDLQEQMLKVEAAIGLTVGIQSIANALQAESALAIGLSTVATKIQTGAQVVYAAVVGTTTGALKALKVALVSTGVGALVVGLGLLIAKLMEGKESTEDLEKAQEGLNDSLKESIELYGRFSKATDFVTKTNILRAKIAGASEKEIQALTQKGFDDEKENLKQQEADLKKRLSNEKASYETKLKIIDQLDIVSKSKIDLDRERQEQQLEFELSLADKRRDANKKASEEAIRIAKEKAEEEKRIAKEKHDALLKEANDFFSNSKDAQEKYDKDYADNLKRQEEELAKVDNPEDKEIKEANRRLVEIENFNGALSEKKAMLDEYSTFVNNQEFLTDEAKKYYENQALERKKIISQQELALSAATFGKISELAGKNSKIGKAFAVGQALINTYQGITAELQTKAVTPYEIGLKVANIAFVASTGFKAVKNILSTNPMSSGGGSGSSSGAGASGGGGAAPQFNLVGQSSTNQLSSTIAGQQNRPVQTYVVGNQVSTQLALDRNAVANSVFG